MDVVKYFKNHWILVVIVVLAPVKSADFINLLTALGTIAGAFVLYYAFKAQRDANEILKGQIKADQIEKQAMAAFEMVRKVGDELLDSIKEFTVTCDSLLYQNNGFADTSYSKLQNMIQSYICIMISMESLISEKTVVRTVFKEYTKYILSDLTLSYLLLGTSRSLNGSFIRHFRHQRRLYVVYNQSFTMYNKYNPQALKLTVYIDEFPPELGLEEGDTPMEVWQKFEQFSNKPYEPPPNRP